MRLSLLFLLFLLISSPLCAETPPKPDSKARCEVCGMFVAPYPQWVSVVEMTDGRHFYFDGPKDMFIYYKNLAKYQPGASYDQVASLYVTEYYTASLTSATGVFFVEGSNVPGPMGMELVPVAGRKTAEIFLKDHKGVKLLLFNGHELLDAPAAP
ncbi:nitrous oxide reductase accessory protein NosL [Geopsychrobacter electrodiphilus]|uniref:nitrous oxide reductase accessory protein NosL n=1 Tax=Geopsychrobacter electrodiphilus TaxID=225196 RepID=UPI000A021F82|nr:nitrous oxide reductase accessory protein NosL [Geopsychrobacter electrodiphilus]